MPEAPKTLSLYEVEGVYQTLLDLEALVPPEMESVIKAELEEALLYAIEKRDKCAHFLMSLARQEDTCDEEMDRIKRHRETLINVRRRLEKYVVSVIRSQGTDMKGKHKQLRGNTTLMYVRALPASVDILDDSIVPSRFKNITVTMPLDLWERMCKEHPELEMHGLMEIKIKYTNTEKEKVRQAIDQNEEVPGADLKMAGHDFSLVVR